jgi:hypothetical protein
MTADAGYYPDVMVACGEQADPYYESTPCLLAEILSPSTRDTTTERSALPSPSTRFGTTSSCIRISLESSTTGAKVRRSTGSSKLSAPSTPSHSLAHQ